MGMKRKTKVVAAVVLSFVMLFSGVLTAQAKKFNPPPQEFEHDGSKSQVYANVDITTTSSKARFKGETNWAWLGANPYTAQWIQLDDEFYVLSKTGASFSISATGFGVGYSQSVNTAHVTWDRYNHWGIFGTFDIERPGTNITTARMTVKGATKVHSNSDPFYGSICSD